MAETLYIPVEEQHQEGEARRAVASWSLERGYSVEERSKLATVVSELGRNLALHTREGGFLLLRQTQKGKPEVEIMALDRGPGMANFAACARDGYSTAGTAGAGLGAVMRGSAFFDVHTQLESGTALLSRLFTRDEDSKAGLRLGLVNVAKKGEHICGDTCAFAELGGGRARLMIADGLGHGPLAAEASELAAKVFREGSGMDLPFLLERMNAALRSTRGAAIAIAEVNAAQQQVRYAGVGNIAGAIVGPGKSTHLVSHNGTVGSTFPKPREFTYGWTSDSSLIMNSDGLKSQWRLDGYVGLQQRHPALVAGVLFRDFNRGSDDSTVATLRLP